MKFKDYDILSIIDHIISEEMFKDKIGTGEELRKLLDEEILIEAYPGNYYVNSNSDKIRNIDEIPNKKELHWDIINYYLKNIDSSWNNDYMKFIDQRLDYIHLSHHYKILGEYDKGIECIFTIAKKLVYWGFGTELLDELKGYSKLKLSETNYLWRLYYLFFYQLVHLIKLEEEEEFLDFVKRLEREDLYGDTLLFLETKNLEGIYYKNIVNDEEKAIEAFKQGLEYFNTIEDKFKDIELTFARILENLAFCSSINKSAEYLSQAEKIFEKHEEHYELAKMYFLKLLILSESDESDFADVLEEYNKINKLLESYSFPDIERNLLNLISKMIFEETNNINQYMEIKLEALTRDIILYFNGFKQDLFDILNKIEEASQYEEIDIIIDSIDMLLNFLEEADFSDEFQFIKGVKAFYLNEDINEELKHIENESLKRLAHKYIDSIKKNKSH